MKISVIFLLVLTICTLPLMSREEKTRRYAIAIGANYGGPGREVLRYAVSDAKSFLHIMEQMGGVQSKYSKLLIEPNSASITAEINKVRDDVLKIKKDDERTEIIIYYSGHSDEDGLLIGREKMNYRDLRKQIDDLPADLKIAILDSCSSGAFTRFKGGKMLSPFMSDPSYNMKGYAFLTSSSSDEVSQESEKIKGSFFTHYLLTGLRGAADMTSDGRITLTEAYQYAYRETLLRTEKTVGGAQHPNYQIQMSGTGDVVLTDFRSNHSLLTFAEPISGRIYINRENTIIAELSKESGEPLSIALDDGSYTLVQDSQGSIYESKVTLKKGKQTTIAANAFSPAKREISQNRGNSDKNESPGVAHTWGVGGYSLTFKKDPKTSENSTEADNENQKPAFSFQKTGTGAQNIIIRNNLIGLTLFPVAPLNPDERMSYSYVFHLFGANCESVDKLIFGLGLAVVRGDSHGCSVSLIGNIIGHDADIVSIGGIFNVVSNNFRGAQISIISNVTMNDLSGVQIAAITNVAGRNVNGAQVSGIINIASQDFNGAQIASLINVNRNNFSGAQLSSLINVTTNNFYGVQLSNIGNIVCGEMSGLQTSLFNYAGTQKGVQIGILNINGDAHGLQIGLFNFANKNDGIPIGLVSFSRSGTTHFSTWADETRNMYAGIIHYNTYIYNVYGAGYDPITKTASLGLGLGARKRFENLAISIDGMCFGTTSNNYNMRNSIRLKTQYYIADRFSLYAGISANHMYVIQKKERTSKPFGYNYYRQSHDKRNRFWPGLFFGVEI
ncbi:MAG TPA: caspase family protein [Spirochaetota bacterium]